MAGVGATDCAVRWTIPLRTAPRLPRRSIWSARQRAALFDLPTDEAALLRHYTLSDDDIEQIRMRRGGHNRLGFALQLCAFRYPGRILVAREAIPLNVLRFIAAQLGMRADSGLSVRFCPLPESTPACPHVQRRISNAGKNCVHGKIS